MPRTFIALALAAAWLAAPHDAPAQQVGPPVPAYVPPQPAAPPAVPPDERELEQNLDRAADADARRAADERAQADALRNFRTAYARRGKPRIAIFWNREFSDTMREWYGSDRIVIGERSRERQGDKRTSRSGETTIEYQTRVPDAGRYQPSEGWQWEFEDGFMAAMFEAGAVLIDRATIVRMTGAQADEDASAAAIEAQALRKMTDLFVEVLVAPSSRTTVGYELRAVVKDVRTGQILANVNSRHMAGWGKSDRKWVATNQGFMRADDELVGPRGGTTEHTATSSGFVKRDKPPPLRDISHDLALNVMAGLAAAWGR